MTGTFQARIPTLSDAELRRYLEHHLEYRSEAVEAAVAELARRGQSLSDEALQEIRSGLAAREAAKRADAGPGIRRVLGPKPAARIRHITAGILAAGLGSASLIYLFARSQADNALGYDPMDTKKYLRDLELFGGKGNVLATEFSLWWQGLWHGRALASTVAWLTVFLALVFWLVATRRARDFEAAEPESGPPER
jgi:hypothetical protein